MSFIDSIMPPEADDDDEQIVADDDQLDTDPDESDEDDEQDDAPESGKDDDADEDADVGGDPDDNAVEVDGKKMVSIDALHAERNRRRKAELAMAERNARESAEFKPEAFADQEELDELTALSEEPDGELTPVQMKRYGELVRAQTLHEQKQEQQKREAATMAGRVAVVNQSLAEVAEKHDWFDEAWPMAKRLLGDEKYSQIVNAGENAGQLAIKHLSATRIVKAMIADKSTQDGSARNERPNKGTRRNRSAEGSERRDEPSTFIDALAG